MPFVGLMETLLGGAPRIAPTRAGLHRRRAPSNCEFPIWDHLLGKVFGLTTENDEQLSLKACLENV